MKKPDFWEKAKKSLIEKDPKLGKLIKMYPKDFLYTKNEPMARFFSIYIELPIYNNHTKKKPE